MESRLTKRDVNCMKLWYCSYFMCQVEPENSRNPSQLKLFDSLAVFRSMKSVIITKGTLVRLHGLEGLQNNSGFPWRTDEFVAWALEYQPNNQPLISFLLIPPHSLSQEQIPPSFHGAFHREGEESPKALFGSKLQMAPWMSDKTLLIKLFSELFPHSSLV